MSPEVSTGLQIGGGLLWSAAYVLIIYRGFADRTLGVPFVSVCTNITWEFFFTFLWPQGTPQLHLNRAWLLLDSAVLVQAFIYGPRDFSEIMSRRAFQALLVATLLIALAYNAGVSVATDDHAGKYAAFIGNFVMSALFVLMVVWRPGILGQSLYIALCKMLGSLAFGLFFIDRDDFPPFLTVTVVLTLGLDLIYTFLVFNRVQGRMRSAVPAL